MFSIECLPDSVKYLHFSLQIDQMMIDATFVIKADHTMPDDPRS